MVCHSHWSVILSETLSNQWITERNHVWERNILSCADCILLCSSSGAEEELQRRKEEGHQGAAQHHHRSFCHRHGRLAEGGALLLHIHCIIHLWGFQHCSSVHLLCLQIRGTLKSWTKLWCVLKPGVLLIYKTHKNGQWVGTVLLNACELIERPSKKDGFCFKLFHPLEQSIWAVKVRKWASQVVVFVRNPSNESCSHEMKK